MTVYSETQKQRQAGKQSFQHLTMPDASFTIFYKYIQKNI